MRIHRMVTIAAVLLVAQVFGTGCVLVPTIKDRVVELVTGAQTAVPFHAQGSINAYSDSKTINLRDSVDVASVISDAGIDVSDVTSITLSGVAYRITVADPTAGRQITNAQVAVAVGGNSSANLVSSFTAKADAATGWITPALTAGGVTQLNNLLAAILAELKGGAPANEHITYTVTGNSTPSATPTNFQYELRISLSIVGKVKTKVLTGA
jgi:hypothetical protein